MAELSPGTEFAGLRVEAVAGRGGMGVVYRAFDGSLGRQVALKVVAAELLGDPGMRARFLRESRSAAAIEHPNVVPIYSAGEQDGVAYIVMRLVPGDDLRDRVRRDGPLEPAAAARIVAQVGSALDAAHEAGLVHRDVKPANILLGAGDHAYLSDFGLARHAVSEAGLTRTGGWVGTLDYVAPEQIQAGRVDGRADVYALGCVLYFALTGRVPFARDSDEARLWAHVHASPPAPSEDAPGVPPAFDAVVRAALAKRPEDRLQTAGELGGAAVAAASGEGGARRARRIAAGAGGDTAPGRGPRGATASEDGAAENGSGGTAVRFRRLLAGALAVGLLAAVAIGAVTLLSADEDDGGAPPPADRQRAAGAAAREFAVGEQPNTIRLAGGNAWVTSAGSRRLGRVEVGTGESRRGPVIGRGARDVAARDGTLWVTLAEQRRIVRLRASDGGPAGPPIPMSGVPKQIDAGAGGIWVGETSEGAGAPDRLVRLDPRTGERVASLELPSGITDIRAVRGAVWVVGRRRPVVLRVDPATRRVVLRRRIAPKPLRVDVAAGYAWVTNHGDDTVARVDPESGEAVPIAVPSKPYGIDARDDAIWVSCYGDHSLVRIDPETSRIAGPPRAVGLSPTGVVADGRSVWVANRADDSVTRLAYR